MMSSDVSLRRKIVSALSEDDIRAVCQDYFPIVYDDLTAGMTKRRMVELLVDHCRRNGRNTDLLAALHQINPHAFPVVESVSQPITPPKHNPRQIFISHASQDADYAHRLAKDLEAHGWGVWIAPDSIHPGEKWVEAISRGLEESGVFVLLLTEHAVKSRWVRDETNVAIELQNEGALRFVPLQIRACRLPALWRAYQRIPFRAGYDRGLNQLVAALDRAQGVSGLPLTPQVQISDPKPQPPDNLNKRKHAKSGLEMVRIPAGKFLYGDDKKELELPEFWISKTPVTNADYARFVQASKQEPPRHWAGNKPPAKIADHPVVNVSWHDAKAYADWADLRLPTEQEWEKAARGTDGREYPWGEWANGRCNTREFSIGDTSLVGQFSPRGDSPYGCVDMSGNVWEWTASLYDESQSWRVLRGGSWLNYSLDARASYRNRDFPNFRFNLFGFRVVRRPPSQNDH